MSVRHVRVAGVCAVVGWLAACGGSEALPERAAGGGSEQPSPEQVAESASTISASDTLWTSGTVSAPSTVQEMVAVLSALRTGKHDGFERVTLELAGGGTGFPAYHVEYIDRPLIECGSGQQVNPVGDAWLEIRMEPLDAHTQEGQPTIPRTPQAVPGLENIQRVYRTCDFEAVTTLVFAVASPNRFRVFTLEEPRRIVVDIGS
jgi:hypothetical protein